MTYTQRKGAIQSVGVGASPNSERPASLPVEAEKNEEAALATPYQNESGITRSPGSTGRTECTFEQERVGVRSTNSNPGNGFGGRVLPTAR